VTLCHARRQTKNLSFADRSHSESESSEPQRTAETRADIFIYALLIARREREREREGERERESLIVTAHGCPRSVRLRRLMAGHTYRKIDVIAVNDVSWPSGGIPYTQCNTSLRTPCSLLGAKSAAGPAACRGTVGCC
jgi:hypothetical protein